MNELLLRAKVAAMYFDNVDKITNDLRSTIMDAIMKMMVNFVVPVLSLALIVLFIWQLVGLVAIRQQGDAHQEFGKKAMLAGLTLIVALVLGGVWITLSGIF